MNLYDNSNIDCNKKKEKEIYLYNNIVLNKYKNSTIFTIYK